MSKFPRLSKGFWITLTISVGLLFLLVVTSPIAVGAAEKSIAVVSLSRLKSLSAAAHEYARDHQGRLPRQLEALVPEYVSEVKFAESRFQNDRSAQRYDWLYFPPPDLKPLPADAILAASPAVATESRQARRVVLMRDGSARLLPESDYQSRLKSQIAREGNFSGGRTPLGTAAGAERR